MAVADQEAGQERGACLFWKKINTKPSLMVKIEQKLYSTINDSIRKNISNLIILAVHIPWTHFLENFIKMVFTLNFFRYHYVLFKNKKLWNCFKMIRVKTSAALLICDAINDLITALNNPVQHSTRFKKNPMKMPNFNFSSIFYFS